MKSLNKRYFSIVEVYFSRIVISIQVTQKVIIEHEAEKRKEEVAALGKLGLHLERFSLGLEIKYDLMLREISKMLSEIKNHMLSVFMEIETECFRKIMNEKQQNLLNIKELEERLRSTLSKLNADLSPEAIKEEQKNLNSFSELFLFLKDFSEESYNMIISRPVKLDITQIKRQLARSTNDHLNRLYDSPKAFLTQLFRFFLRGQDQEELKEDDNYGNAFIIENPMPQLISIEPTNNEIDTELDTHNKAPVIHIIQKNYMIAATRNEFKIFYFSFVEDNLFKKKKSRFGKNKSIGNTKTQFYCEAILSHKDVDMNDVPLNPGYHCSCFLSTSEDRDFLLLGGNRNTIYIFEIEFNDFRMVSKMIYKGHINFKEHLPNMTKQKINQIIQYKSTDHLIAILSYGYVVTFSLDFQKGHVMA